jgi:hypothetical protein
MPFGSDQALEGSTPWAERTIAPARTTFRGGFSRMVRTDPSGVVRREPTPLVLTIKKGHNLLEVIWPFQQPKIVENFLYCGRLSSGWEPSSRRVRSSAKRAGGKGRSVGWKHAASFRWGDNLGRDVIGRRSFSSVGGGPAGPLKKVGRRMPRPFGLFTVEYPRIHLNEAWRRGRAYQRRCAPESRPKEPRRQVFE